MNKQKQFSNVLSNVISNFDYTLSSVISFISNYRQKLATKIKDGFVVILLLLVFTTSLFLGKVYFVVNLYSFPLPYLQGKSFDLLTGRTAFKTPPSRHISNSRLSVYLFLKSEPELGKSEEFNNHGIKENKTYKSYSFLSPKKQHTGFAWNFLETPV